ncbi:MAG: hypothetical protein ABR950_06005 [Candidatus Dormibacteria bacterium]|jgi:hypothetical protein
MRFGGNQLPLRIRVARTILYCQATVLMLIAVFTFAIVTTGGTGSGLRISGIADEQTLTGSEISTLAVALIAIGVVLVVVEQQVRKRGGDARLVLAGVELVSSVGLITFVSDSAGMWLFCPVFGIAVVILHYWPELHSYFYASETAAAPPVIAAPPAPVSRPDPGDPPSPADPPGGGST